MKTTKHLRTLAAGLVLVITLTACDGDTTSGSTALPADTSAPSPASSQSQSAASLPQTAQSPVYLYGERHAQDNCLEAELSLWVDFYQNQGLRHLFVELPYYTAELLNQWMAAEDDTMLDAIYDEWVGTASHSPNIKVFYQSIKRQCPQTVFHGTDVGHQYNSTGPRYLAMLEAQGQKDSPQYQRAEEVIQQGLHYYGQGGDLFRENQMVENFLWALESVGDQPVMGIYGAAHTGLDALDFTGTIPCMAAQLYEKYGDRIHSEDLSWAEQRVDTLTVGGKDYAAPYFGRQDLTGFKDYLYRDFWRLEEAYDDFADAPKTGDILPYGEYPMSIEIGQVFVTDYTHTDGSITRLYHRADGNDWEGMPITEGFTPPDA